MKLFGIEISFRKKEKMSRNYSGAKNSNSTADWLTTGLVADELLRWQLPKLRERSRDLQMNNDYMKNFLRKLKVNVIGANGIQMQSKARLKNGTIDKRSNELVEQAWKRWTKRRNASTCGTLSLKDIANAAIESVARDGEVLIRKIKGYDNQFNFALQIIEADHLDTLHNENLQNGNTIRLGIEKNAWGKPIAYWLWSKHPGEASTTINQTQKRIRIPAEEIIHMYLKERPTQSRGVPWAHTAIIRLRQLGAYEEAAIVNARIGASKMQTIIMGEGHEYTGDATDPYGNKIDEVEPGMRELMPAGTQLHDFQPAYPSGDFGPFNKAMLRGISSGIGCSYNSIANDLEGVNFSSLRSGLLEERDSWKVVQLWFIEFFLDEVVRDWADMAILSGQLPLAYSDIDIIINEDTPKWQGRRWEWVDPEKDINARITELKAGLTTRTRIAAEKGEDFEEILEELAEEQKMIDASGLQFNLDGGKPAEIAPADNTDGTEGQQTKLFKGGTSWQNEHLKLAGR